jgi:hypothetical protein
MEVDADPPPATPPQSTAAAADDSCKAPEVPAATAPPAPSQEEVDAERGFTDDDLNACLKVRCSLFFILFYLLFYAFLLLIKNMISPPTGLARLPGEAGPVAAERVSSSTERRHVRRGHVFMCAV